MRNKIIEFTNFLLILLSLTLIIISSIRITYYDMEIFTYSNHVIFIGVLALINYIISKIKNLKFNKYELIIFLLIILSCLSLINAINIEEALFGR